jgi:hypothetical protein
MPKTKEKESLNSFEKFLLNKGKNQRDIEIATNMLKKGTNIEFVSEVTSLKISDVEELNKNIN